MAIRVFLFFFHTNYQKQTKKPHVSEAFSLYHVETHQSASPQSQILNVKSLIT